MSCCLRDPTFSRFDTIPACDTHTQTRDDGYYQRIACALRVKMEKNGIIMHCGLSLMVLILLCDRLIGTGLHAVCMSRVKVHLVRHC